MFAVWWLTVLVLGWCSFPLCQYLFSGFRDRGYLVAKIFGIAGAGFLMWLGASTGIVSFTHVGCLVSTGVLAAVCWGVWIAIKKQKIKDKTSWKFTAEWYQTVLDDELVFILFFLLWTMWQDFARQRTEQKSSWTMGYDGDDAQYHTSGEGSVVCGSKNKLLLWRTVFCCVFNETDQYAGGTDLQSDADTGGRVLFFRSVCSGTSDGT